MRNAQKNRIKFFSHDNLILSTTEVVVWLIIIGDHVWIGLGGTVLKAVTMKSNSVVGVKSIVTKNIPLTPNLFISGDIMV